MLYLGSHVRYFYYNKIVDMRKGCYGLCGLVNNEMKRDLFTGDVFVFMNRRHNKIKLLQWDNDGFALYEKRLEKGTYELPGKAENSTHVTLNNIELQYIIQGVLLQSVRRKKRYEHTSQICANTAF